MPRILCSPDIHCFWPTFNRTGEDGIPSRLQDWRRSAQALLRTAVEHKVSAALFPGDYFPNSRPSPIQILEVATFFERLEDAGVTVVGCKGNHDDLGPGQVSPVDLVGRMAPDSRRWGWTKPGIERLPALEVVVLPFTKAVKADADPAVAAQETSQQLIQIAHHWLAMADPSKPVVLIGHWAVSGCRLAAGNSLAATEPTLPLADLQALPGVRAVVMGHIHTPQVIATDPVVLHTGALERHDFGEERNECGCYIVDLDTQEVEFVGLPARRFVTVDLEGHNLEHIAQDETPADELFLTGYEAVIRDAIVRVTYQATEEQAKRIDPAAIIKALDAAGAHQIAGIYPEIIRSERAREASVTETTSPVEALEKWLGLQTDLSDGTRARVAEKARTLLEEVRV